MLKAFVTLIENSNEQNHIKQECKKWLDFLVQTASVEWQTVN